MLVFEKLWTKLCPWCPGGLQPYLCVKIIVRTFINPDVQNVAQIRISGWVIGTVLRFPQVTPICN